MKEKIIIWGAGKKAQKYLDGGCFEKYSIIAVVDSNKQSDYFAGAPVILPSEIIEFERKAKYIVVATIYYEEIIEKLKEFGIDDDKIVITNIVKYNPFQKYTSSLLTNFKEIYEIEKHHALISVRENESDVNQADSIYCQPDSLLPEYKSDYFRYRTFEFVADEIIERKIPGAIAEVGVFRGVFSAVMNRKFHDRKLYLFDTFEGFNESEAEKEMSLGRCTRSFIEGHKDTSVERMIQNLPHPENAVICQGFFPDTVTKEIEKETFSFVSLDVDFEESTLEGLKFFYPRLAQGGYIFIHDYNTFFLEGIKVAVKRFEKEYGEQLKLVPLADRAGTVVVVK